MLPNLAIFSALTNDLYFKDFTRERKRERDLNKLAEADFNLA